MRRSPVRTFVTEHYRPGVTPEAFHLIAGSLAAAADGLARSGIDVRFLHATLVRSDEVAYCVLTAPTSREVEQVYEAAGLGYERLLDAVESPVPEAGRT